MSEYPHLKNAPIVEALLDIQVDSSPEITLPTLEKIYQSVKSRFPEKQQRNIAQFQFEQQVGQPPKMSDSLIGSDGFIFLSSDKSKALQVRLEGFSLSKLKPYTNWEEFRDEAKELWQLYIKVAKPIRVRRIALRYINQLVLPSTGEDLKKYISTFPEISGKFNSIPKELFMRLVLPQNDLETTAILTEAFGSTQKEGSLTLTFDIDVFQEKNLVPTSEKIWEAFEKIRGIKNEIFFSSITEDTERLYQ